jgi:triacylglycerol lipase
VVSGRNPVVLLHGIFDSAAVLDCLCAFLRQRGWVTHTFNLVPRFGQAGIDVLARQVADYVGKTFAPGEKIDLVGFSMGGLVARYYLQRLGGLERVSRLVTISSPHRGTWTAFLLGNVGVRQMRPGSAFLTDLDKDRQVLKRIRFTTIWTPWDLMILPAASSVIPEGRPVRISVGWHRGMVRDRRVLREVERALLE